MAYKATGRPIQPPEEPERTADLITACPGPPAEPGEHGGRDGRHCSCHDEDDVLPCCICGELSDDYEGNGADDDDDDDPDGPFYLPTYEDVSLLDNQRGDP